MEITFDIVFGEKMINDIMHSCDVFEQSKEYAIHEQMSMEIKDGWEINLENTIITLHNTLSKQFNIVFIGIREIDGQIFNFPPPHIKYGVSAISNGEKWGLFKDVLSSMGYIAETDECMKVTSAYRKQIIKHE